MAEGQYWLSLKTSVVQGERNPSCVGGLTPKTLVNDAASVVHDVAYVTLNMGALEAVLLEYHRFPPNRSILDARRPTADSPVIMTNNDSRKGAAGSLLFIVIQRPLNFPS